LIAKIISGGQDGVDQVALQVARALGISTGGWAPKGWRTDKGSAPWLADYGLQEHLSSDYRPRTHHNVRDSDGTLIFGWPHSSGCTITRRYCEALRRPFLVCSWPNNSHDPAFRVQFVEDWIMRNDIQTLNVAGNREEKNPGVSAACEAFLREVLR
jgi:hypothetical protein